MVYLFRKDPPYSLHHSDMNIHEHHPRTCHVDTDWNDKC